MKKIIVKILMLIFSFGLMLFAIYMLFKDDHVYSEKTYLEESDYYFKGAVLESYALAVNFHRVLVIRVDSIDLKKVAPNNYIAAYNQETNEVIFYTAILIEPNNPEVKRVNPSYIIVDSKTNSIRYNDGYDGYSGNYKVIRTMGLYKKDFDRFLASRGGRWIRF